MSVIKKLKPQHGLKKGGRRAVAFRVLAETAPGRGARAATAVPTTTLP